MATGNKTGGRQQGTPNKVTANVKDNIIAVFNKLGGTSAMAEWAQDNQTQFYNMYSKLIPFKIEGDSDNPLTIITKVELVPLSNNDNSADIST